MTEALVDRIVDVFSGNVPGEPIIFPDFHMLRRFAERRHDSRKAARSSAA